MEVYKQCNLSFRPWRLPLALENPNSQVVSSNNFLWDAIHYTVRGDIAYVIRFYFEAFLAIFLFLITIIAIFNISTSVWENLYCTI